MEYLISWTFKVVPPQGGEPDFIRVETTITQGENPEQVVSELRNSLLAAGWQVAETRGMARAAKPSSSTQPMKGKPRPVEAAEAPPRGSEPLMEGVDGSDIVWKMNLERRPDKRYTLTLYSYLSDGREMEYPLLRYTSEREDMETMLTLVGWPLEDADLPEEHKVGWMAHWKFGKQAKKGRYKDLLKLEPAGE